ncbi:hypothetical protein MA16_Dca020386 [Dendrobium catenatum]|uniref:Uncharacterized protein n=1 Tax=Dendrobium catenatum TaxID=906689 RepID=A0A2I0VVM2_9ASPA|nr:hypothetical protein MA16_Dca020386 [Dendrobium catenatum]
MILTNTKDKTTIKKCQKDPKKVIQEDETAATTATKPLNQPAKKIQTETSTKIVYSRSPSIQNADMKEPPHNNSQNQQL